MVRQSFIKRRRSFKITHTWKYVKVRTMRSSFADEDDELPVQVANMFFSVVVSVRH